MEFSDTLSVLTLALVLEAAVGYPAPLFSAIGHPVTWIGALIAWLEARLNRGWEGDRSQGLLSPRRLRGGLALIVILGLPGLAAFALERLVFDLLPPAVALAALAIAASSLLAQRSLHDHVAAVRDGLRAGGLEAGRRAVSMIVGRNPDVLDEAGVCRAAIESLAENFSDGITAPAVWTGAFGLTGGVVYKAANTADSMIGHRSDRHRLFGTAAARFDDLVNLPASRLTAMLLVLAALGPGTSAAGALRAVRRDAGRHRSPNAGWPEAAMAGALGLRLAGPRVYGDRLVDDHWMGDGRSEATADDVDRALALYRRALVLLLAGAAVCLAVSLR